MSYHFGFQYDAAPVLQPTPQYISFSPASQQKLHQLTPPRRWLGRIEKPRSVRTSPSALDRVRGWPASTAGRQMQQWQLQALLGASQPSAFPDSTPVMRQQNQHYQPQQRQYQRPLSWHPSSLSQPNPQNTHHLSNAYHDNSNTAYHLLGSGMQFPPPVSTSIMSPAPSMAYSPDPFMLPATPPLVSDSAMYSTATSANASPNWPLQMQHQPQQMMMPNTYQLPSPAVSLSQQPCWEQKITPQVAQPVQQHQVQPVQPAQQVQQVPMMQAVQHVQPQELLLRTPQVVSNPQKTIATGLGSQPVQTHAELTHDVIDLTADDQENDAGETLKDDEILADAHDEQGTTGDEDAEAEEEDEEATACANDSEVDRSDVVLVGLGLYDPPQRSFGAPGGLRLITESWQPPADSAAGAEEDDDDDDEQGA